MHKIDAMLCDCICSGSRTFGTIKHLRLAMTRSIERQLDYRELEDFKRSLARLRGLGDLPEEFKVCQSIGLLYRKLGQPVKSLQYFFSCLSIAKGLESCALKCESFDAIAKAMLDPAVRLYEKAIMYAEMQVNELDPCTNEKNRAAADVDHASVHSAFFLLGVVYIEREDTFYGAMASVYLKEARKAFLKSLSLIEKAPVSPCNRTGKYAPFAYNKYIIHTQACVCVYICMHLSIWIFTLLWPGFPIICRQLEVKGKHHDELGYCLRKDERP